MYAVFVICIIIVIVVLILAVVTTSKAYSFKHTVDSLEENPYLDQENQKMEQDKQE